MSIRDGETQGVERAAALIAAAREGSASALNELVSAYRPYLLRIATQDLPQDLQGKLGASDLVQESLLQAAGNFSDFAGESEAELLGWMRRILLNQMLNTIRHYRTAKRNATREQAFEVEARSSDRSPSSEALVAEERLLIDAALAQLSERHREVIALRHQYDLTFVEIGQRLECSEDAARKLWSRAIVALQRQFELHG